MANRVSEWESFWDICSPPEAARMLRADYGTAAPSAAEHCAQAARADRRHDDASFWQAVCDHLRELEGLV